MPSPLIERMKTLCSLPGPPGHEGAVRDALAEMVKDSASELRRDGIGNLIACHEANEAAPHLLLECHMDEVGLIVTNVEAGGAIRFEKVGLVADAIFPGREVALLTLDGNLHRGVVNVRSGHLQSLQGQEHPGVEEMWIDLGASDDEKIRALGIEAGTPGVFHSPFTQLPGGAWKSKAVDNRSGCALCVEAFINTANSLSDKLRLSAAFCAQEEIGGRGASVLSLDETGADAPSLAIVLDNVPSDGPGRSDARGLENRGGAGFEEIRPPTDEPLWLHHPARADPVGERHGERRPRAPAGRRVLGHFSRFRHLEQIPAGRIAHRADKSAQALFPQSGGDVHGIGPGSHGGAHRRSTALRRRGRSTESEAGLPNAL